MFFFFVNSRIPLIENNVTYQGVHAFVKLVSIQFLQHNFNIVMLIYSRIMYILLAFFLNTHKVFGNCLLDLSQCGRESCNPDGKVPF